MRVIVVMGVAGAGKSTVAALVARRLRLPLCEGDDLHPPANVARMRAGLALDDRDRAPWLARIGRWIACHRHGAVVTCSALKRRYRDRLRRAGDLVFVLLDPPAAVLARRLRARRGHFMPARLLGSQLAALERPTGREHAIVLRGRTSAAALADRVILRARRTGRAEPKRAWIA